MFRNHVKKVKTMKTKSDISPQDPTHRLFWQLPAFLAFAIAIWWAYRISIGSLSGESEIDRQGQFGDMFGGLNALVSMMGFVGLFVSLNLQRQQFQASLADMRENAEAAKAEATAIKAQTLALEKSNGFAEAQNAINATQVHIANLSAQLNAQLVLYGIWEKKSRPSNSRDATIHDAEGQKIQNEIRRLIDVLSGIDTSLIITRFPY